MKTTAARMLDPHPSSLIPHPLTDNLPPPDINLHPSLADADINRRIRYLRLIAAGERSTPRGRLAAAELRMIENQQQEDARAAS